MTLFGLQCISSSEVPNSSWCELEELKCSISLLDLHLSTLITDRHHQPSILLAFHECEHVTDCIVKLFYKFGAPKRLLTDQGKEFVNKVNMGVCQLLGIKRSLCAPYHPQTNGLVERLNGRIQRSLSKLVGKQPHKWSDYLEATMFGLRTKKQVTTKYSPYYLMFGREARYPSEVPDKYEINESVEDILAEECISECIKRQDRIFQTVRDNISCAQQKAKKRKLEKGLSVDIKVGDRVLRKNIRSRQRKGGKLDPDSVPRPPSHLLSVPRPPSHLLSVPRPPSHLLSVPRPPSHLLSVPRPPSHLLSVPRPPSHLLSVPRPPSHLLSVPRPPSHLLSVPRPPSHLLSVPRPPSHLLSVPRPPSHLLSVPRPPSHLLSVPRPPSHLLSVPRPPSHLLSVPRPPSHLLSVPRPPSHLLSVPRPPSHLLSVPRPPSHLLSVPRPPSQTAQSYYKKYGPKEKVVYCAVTLAHTKGQSHFSVLPLPLTPTP
ncbi:uncharacterized protein [Misgurnus anguillicaudatus]|uniref:uncharacterized protein n=1 Tax=Misgurnus anguillicaudatus TaxID=75329 RepID=UPI003CCF2093